MISGEAQFVGQIVDGSFRYLNLRWVAFSPISPETQLGTNFGNKQIISGGAVASGGCDESWCASPFADALFSSVQLWLWLSCMSDEFAILQPSFARDAVFDEYWLLDQL